MRTGRDGDALRGSDDVDVVKGSRDAMAWGARGLSLIVPRRAKESARGRVVLRFVGSKGDKEFCI